MKSTTGCPFQSSRVSSMSEMVSRPKARATSLWSALGLSAKSFASNFVEPLSICGDGCMNPPSEVIDGKIERAKGRYLLEGTADRGLEMRHRVQEGMPGYEGGIPGTLPNHANAG